MAQGGAGLFRLIAGKRTLAEIQAESVILGTHSGADFVLNDPLVAERHARLSCTGAGFVLEDLGGATGTYLDGLAVEGATPVHGGARVVLGVTRLSLAVGEEQGRPLLCATIEEARFHFKVRDVEAFQSDPDEWVRSEVRFGRVPLVATLTWSSALLGLLTMVFVLGTGPGERLLMPGPLDGSHAALFESGALGCAGCHTGLGGDSVGVDGCGACHGEMLQVHHPFHATAADAAHGELADGACALCHSGHGGRDVPAALVHARARAAAVSCSTCHAEPLPSAAARPLVPPAPVARAYGFDPFSHAAHLAALPGLDCSACHVRGGDSDGFAPISHRACLACHDGANVEPALRRRLELADLIWQPAWHGTSTEAGTGCLACHAEPYKEAPASRVVARSEGLSVDWIPRDHAPDFDAQRCGECHASPERLVPPAARRTSPFDHGQHLARQALEAPGELFDQSCLACHANLIEGSADPSQRVLPPLEACASCHVDAEGAGTVLAFVELGARVERSSVPFSHAGHAAVEGGCHACHTLEPEPTGSGITALTRPESLGCLPCHAGHAHVGGDSCRGCHPPSDPATMALFGGGRPERAGAGLVFPHFAPGHAAAMGSSEGCLDCHPRATLEGSSRVEELVLAPGVLATCRECHVREGRPFHWF